MPALMLLGMLGPRAGLAQPVESLAACPPDTAERIRFIEGRLDQRRRYAKFWWYGWTSGYGVGTIVESVQAGREDDTGRRADYTVSAVKALFGTVRLAFSAPNARLGADPIRDMSTSDPAACQRRLEAGEVLLRKNAEESHTRWSWKRHLINVGVNVAGGVIVAEGFDESRGWTSMGVGIAVGEAMLFSYPWHGDDDLADYQARFGGAPAGTRLSWQLVPWQQGLQLRVRF